jgi:hypothetical protein
MLFQTYKTAVNINRPAAAGMKDSKEDQRIVDLLHPLRVCSEIINEFFISQGNSLAKKTLGIEI